jgi:uncharacterized membrane protein YbaN (DUF454 family)
VSALPTTSPAPVLAHEPRAFRLARRTYGVFFLLMAGVNVVLASSDPTLYAGFADEALVPAYGELYRSVVGSNVEVLVAALIAFEVVIGLTLWFGRARSLRAALWAAVVFQLVLVPANVHAAWNLLLVLVPLGLLWWHRALSSR